MADLKKEENNNNKLGGGMEEDEEEKLVILDFDALCSTVAMQSQGKWRLLDNNNNEEEEEEEEGVSGGILRMWEGEVLDCFDDRRIAIQSFCCPCYRFGKNMRRAGLGSCFVQGTIHFLLALCAFLNCIAFMVTRRHTFLYLAVVFTVSVGMYLGFFRTQTRKKFNIRGSDSSLDDCVHHLICPCCTMSQESRTLEMNNVQGGTWHGRGDTICIGTINGSGKAFVELHPPPPVSAYYVEPKAIPKGKVDIYSKQ